MNAPATEPITLAELKTWSDEKILTYLENVPEGKADLHECWNETVHPETLFIDFYDEVMCDTYTTEEKAKLYEEVIDSAADTEDEDGNEFTTLDSLLEANEYLKEDAGELSEDINPKYARLLKLYMFKWLLASEDWGDKFLFDYVNG